MTSRIGILAHRVRLWRCGWDGLATLERSMETSPGPRILLTGFEPFGGDVLNPSGLVCRALHGQRVAHALVHAVELPCVFGRALQALDEALAQTSPVLVVALGLAAGRAEISVERVAINVDDARIPDNAGAQPVDVPVVEDGPAAWFSTLPVKAIVAALQEAGLPGAVSQTAGTFVCNHLFYGLQHRLAGSAVRSGFVHVPLLDEQADAYPGYPTLALDELVRGVRIVLEVGLTHTGRDLALGAGAVA
jgi:pyroglutamyl-peptidase